MSKLPKKQADKVKEQTEPYNEHDRYEIIDDVRYELQPSPTVKHQKILNFLNMSLYKTCQPDGVILLSPIDVYFDDGNIVQPDLIFISNDNQHIIKEKRIEGTPDLVVEILSPSTSTNDKIRKKAQYERFGVKEYWIVDPVHLFVDQFVLDDNTSSFILKATFSTEDTLVSDQFACVTIPLNELLKL